MNVKGAKLDEPSVIFSSTQTIIYVKLHPISIRIFGKQFIHVLQLPIDECGLKSPYQIQETKSKKTINWPHNNQDAIRFAKQTEYQLRNNLVKNNQSII